jgi:hypothetical protein
MKKFRRDWESGTTSNFKMSWLGYCASPDRSRIVLTADIRRAMFKVFHFDLVYREVDGSVQVLAIAHHRRQPGYWVARLQLVDRPNFHGSSPTLGVRTTGTAVVQHFSYQSQYGLASDAIIEDPWDFEV